MTMNRAGFCVLSTLLLFWTASSSQEFTVNTRAWQSSEVYVNLIEHSYEWIQIWAQCLLQHIQPLEGRIRVHRDDNFWEIVKMTREIFEDSSVFVGSRGRDNWNVMLAGTGTDDFMRFSIRYESGDARISRTFELRWINNVLEGTMMEHVLRVQGRQAERAREEPETFHVRKVTPILNISDECGCGLLVDFMGGSIGRTSLVLTQKNLDSRRLQRVQFDTKRWRGLSRRRDSG